MKTQIQNNNNNNSNNNMVELLIPKKASHEGTKTILCKKIMERLF